MLIYPTPEQVVQFHANTVRISGGGSTEVHDLNPLLGVLDHIQNDDYYPEIEDKVAHLLFCAAKFHCFKDGNKRLAIAISAYMLLANGYLACANTFLPAMENTVVHVADGKIDKELLREIVAAHILQDSDNEELKAKILVAISFAPNP